MASHARAPQHRSSTASFHPTPRNWVAASVVAYIVLSAIMRVWLSYSWNINQPYWAPADDGLVVREAIGGVNDYLTITKRPGFSLFLKIVHLSHVPLTIWIAAAWIAAALALAWTVQRICGRWLVTAIAFTLAVWCPVGFDAQIGQRAYRGSILSPAVLLLAAALVAMFVARSWVSRLAWALIVGITTGWIWLAKEDSLWIIPMVLVACIACVIKTLTSRERRIAGVLVLLPVLLIPVAGDMAARARSEHFWGVNLLETRTEGELAGFVSRVYRIEAPNRTYKRWSPDTAIDQALKAAPELENLRPYLMAGMYRENHGDDLGIWGDYLTWQLRYAISSANGDQWPSQADLQQLFARANQQLDDAAARGEITYDQRFTPGKLVAPISWDDVRDRVLPLVGPAMLQTLIPREWQAPIVDTRPITTARAQEVKDTYLAYINENERPQRHLWAATVIERGWVVLAVVGALCAVVGALLGMIRRHAEAFIAVAFALYALVYVAAECWFLVFLDGDLIWVYAVANAQPLVVAAVGVALAAGCMPRARAGVKTPRVRARGRHVRG